MPAATTNPFPGMNPFLQDHWSDVHTKLIGYISDALAEDLPPDLTARAEERVVVGEGSDGRSYRTDVAVIEPWRGELPALGTLETNGGAGAVAVAEPLLFVGKLRPERWVEIHDAEGSLVTVLEILSPANKTETGARSYRRRQQHFLTEGVNLVEIDLVRGGAHIASIDRERLAFPPGTCHLVCVSRIFDEEDLRWEVYLCPLREPLPAIRVPLRLGDPDAPLALQPLIDRCYRTGRYWLSLPAPDARPPAADDAEAAWVEERLRAAGLR